MTSPRIAMLMRFLSDDLALTMTEMTELRACLDAKICACGVPRTSGEPPRTLYLPSEPLDDL